MKVKKLLLIIIILGIPNLVLAQLYKPGYVITLDNDTIAGIIKSQAEFKYHEKIYFIAQQGNESEYFPGEIKGYYFQNGQFFQANNVVGLGWVFLERLIDGRLSLFGYKDQFVVKKKNRKFHILKQTVEKVRTGQGDEAYRTSTQYRGILNFLIADCGNLTPQAYNTSYTQRSITNLVSNYNRCMASEYNVYQENIPWVRLKFGIIGYYARTTLKIKPINSKFGYMTGTYHSRKPGGGIFINISFPRISNENLSVQLETIYSTNAYSINYKLEERFNKVFYETFFDYESMALPMSLQYSLGGRQLNPYFNLGLNMKYNFNFSSSEITEQPSGEVIYTYRENDFLEFTPVQLGIWGEIGVSRALFNTIEVQFGVRYNQMSKLFGTGLETPNFNRLNLVIGLKQL